MAFLSGFMAEDAFASIQAAGKRLFATDENNDNINGNGEGGTTEAAVVEQPQPAALTEPPNN
ncbi:MAG: hypothetical protein ABNH38_17370 [Tateyamaria sp.]|uniref:hypothetical protein n=2 Tax=Tateyamaria sp. TaxID=1929288 RepID=UPI0032DC5B8E